MSSIDGQAYGVVVSNGFNKFHLGATASGLWRYGRLRKLITGAYPRLPAQLYEHPSLPRKLQRFAARAEELPTSEVVSLWRAELISEIGRALLRSSGAARAEARAMTAYSDGARRIVRRYGRSGDVYHFRSGFGLASVDAAREIGMFALCDHSMVHPGAWASLMRSGEFGTVERAGSPILRTVLADVSRDMPVVVNSEFARDSFLHCGFDPALIHVVSLGVDDVFRRLVDAQSPTRVRGRMRFLFAGRLEPGKGIEVLQQALALAPDLDAEFRLAGAISSEMTTRLRCLLTDGRVSYLGYLNRELLAREMVAADCFVLPTLAEGSARVIFEAMYASNFVITTPNAGSILPEAYGQLIPPLDATALAAALESCTSRGQLTREAGRANRQLVTQHYTQRHYIEKLTGLYSRVRAS